MARWLTLEDGTRTLDDIGGPGLEVLFCGYNPNPLAVAERHYYHRKANRFWEDLHESGLVPRLLRGPDEDLLLPSWGLGLTDAVKRPTPTIDGLGSADYREGFARLGRLVEAWQPRLLVFNGLGLLELHRRHGPSLPCEVMAVPSTSPRNNGRRAERLAAFEAVKARLEAIRSGRDGYD